MTERDQMGARSRAGLNWGALPGLLACLVPLILHFTGVALR